MPETRKVYFTDLNQVKDVEVESIQRSSSRARGPLDELLNGPSPIGGRVNFVEVPGYRIHQVLGPIQDCEYVAVPVPR